MDCRQRKLLIELRSKLVGAMHVQPFTIYSDAVIEALIERKPTTLKELSLVKGFPESGKRIKGFGELVIAIFRDTDSVDAIEVSGSGKNVSVEIVHPISAF